MLDIFNTDAFSLISMTTRINNLPFVPGQLGSLGVFEEDGISTTTAVIEEQDFTLGLVAPTPRGGPGETAPKDGSRIRSVIVPHYQRDEAVMADEVQGVRMFGTDDQAMTIEALIARKMRKHTIAFDATLEHQRIGALKGLVLDKNGNVLVDLGATFGVTIPTAIDWSLGTSTTGFRSLAISLKLAVESALDGVPYTGITILCGTGFFTRFTTAPGIEKFYLNYQAALELAGNADTDRYKFGGLEFIRYRTGAQASASLTAAGPFIPDNGAIVVVRGVPNLYQTYFAPADYVETVNTIGLPRYAKQFDMPNGKGRNMEMQTNAISICTRPKVLLSLTTSN